MVRRIEVIVESEAIAKEGQVPQRKSSEIVNFIWCFTYYTSIEETIPVVPAVVRLERALPDQVVELVPDLSPRRPLEADVDVQEIVGEVAEAAGIEHGGVPFCTIRKID